MAAGKPPPRDLEPDNFADEFSEEEFFGMMREFFRKKSRPRKR